MATSAAVMGEGWTQETPPPPGPLPLPRGCQCQEPRRQAEAGDPLAGGSCSTPTLGAKDKGWGRHP